MRGPQALRRGHKGALLGRVSPPEWQAGHVVAHDYREESFPPNVFAAYQVKILDGTLIFAPVDVDECIRAA